MLEQMITQYKGEFINDILASIVNNDTEKLDDCIDAYKIMLKILSTNKLDVSVSDKELNNIQLFYNELLFKRRRLNGQSTGNRV